MSGGRDGDAAVSDIDDAVDRGGEPRGLAVTLDHLDIEHELLPRWGEERT